MKELRISPYALAKMSSREWNDLWKDYGSDYVLTEHYDQNTGEMVYRMRRAERG